MSSKLLSAIVILCLGLTLPACVTVPTQNSAVREPDKAEISRQYTYWIEMTSLTVEDDQNVSRTGQITPLAMRDQSRKIYVPFFAIDEGKFEIPLKAWEIGLGEKTFSLPGKVYSDRHLTVEDNGIDLVDGFQKTGLESLADGTDYFHHTVYAHMPCASFIKAEFQIAREPSRFGTPMEADRAFFDANSLDFYVPAVEGLREPMKFLTTLGKRAIAIAIDLIFVADRIFKKSKRVATEDYLARISQSSSGFYKDYLEYEQGRITEDNLIERLFHVAMIGDSLTKNAYVSSIPSLLWRVRTQHQKNWFLDIEKSPDSIYSVYERLEKLTPLVAVEYSGVGATVDSGKAGGTFFQMLSKTRNFSQQVNQILQGKRFPDLLLIWIGHNNVNWAKSLDRDGRKNPEKHLQKQMWRFRKNYSYSLQLLVDRAKKEKHKTVIVVYGLVNFEAFFKARETAEALKAKQPGLYPYLEADYQIFVSMKPQYRNNMIRLALMMNAELRDLVRDLNQELKNYPNVRLEYSNALATTDFSSVDLIHRVDAWHPSVKGHNSLAEAAFTALSQSLQFLGVQTQ